MGLPVATPIQLQKGLKTTFLEQLNSTSPLLLPAIATYANSDSDQEDYSWLGEVQQVVEFKDEVQYDQLTEAKYNLANKKYAGGLAIKRDDLADEKTGGLALRVRDLAFRAAMMPDEMLVDALVNGTVAGYNSYDGVTFFNANHPARAKEGGVQSNIVAYTGNTTANAQTDIGNAIAALYNMKDEAGKPTLNRGYRRFFIIYPSALHKPISEAVTAGVVSSTSNVQFNGFSIELINEPLLTATSDAQYYMGIADAPVRGLIYQDREPVSFEALEGNGSDETFDREVYKYKARFRGVAGYARWQRLVKITA